MLSKVSIPEIYQHQSIFPSYYNVENIKKIYSLILKNLSKIGWIFLKVAVMNDRN